MTVEIERAGLGALKIQDDPEAIFQEGWMLCDVGEHERGLADLERAVAKGYFVAPTLTARPQFDPLRGEPRFQALLADAEAGRARALAAFRDAGGERLLGAAACRVTADEDVRPRRCRDEIVRRLAAVRADSERRWGTMTAAPDGLSLRGRLPDGCPASDAGRHQHGHDAQRDQVGRALRADAMAGGHPDGAGVRSAHRRDAARRLRRRRRDAGGAPRRGSAAATRGAPWPRHPIFGRMSQRAWLRWAYLHMDHHLRQFGA